MNSNYKFNASLKGKNSTIIDMIAINLASQKRIIPTNKEVFSEVKKFAQDCIKVEYK